MRMHDNDIVWLGAVALGRLIRSGEVTAVQATRAYLDRIDRIDPSLETYITVTKERALSEAAAADAEIAAGAWRGPLHGVPYCLKDIVQTAGIRTTAGSSILSDWVPEEDATVQTRLAEAGAVLLGKVNTHEFAFGATTQTVHAKTKNPWDTSRSPAGSSGGSGAALAAGLAAFSIGSDTGGSIRGPAAFCGIAGLKPTWGLVSAAGVVAQSFTSDHIGPMARQVEDLACIMGIIAGPDATDPTCLTGPTPDFLALGLPQLDGLRVGVVEELKTFPIQPGVAAAFEATLRRLEKLGARIVPLSQPMLGRARAINNAIIPTETMAQHERWQAGWFKDRTIRYGDDVTALLATGAAVSGTATILAQRDRITLRQQLAAAFAGKVDVLLAPTLPMTAQPPHRVTVDLGGKEYPMLDSMIQFLCGFSLAGVPTLALPVGLADDGLPVSVQIVGPHLHDARVLAVGLALEQDIGPLPRPPGM
jgi:aspartyl-tRNA(Asn)/glutamyl-tRNA(Gln) amidotransferase subunit A